MEQQRPVAGGDDVVLVARSEDKLNELAERLRSAQSVEATVIPSDLSKPTAVDDPCEQLSQRSLVSRGSLAVDTLGNNAGFGALGKFAELSADRQTDMLMVNDPGWKNRLMVTGVGFLPRFATRKMVGKMQGI